jgi:hypothetical protein
MRRTTALSGGFGALLAGFGAFEAWNHETGLWPLVVFGLAPDTALLAGRRGGRLDETLHGLTGPLVLGLAGFWLPGRHRLQVGALGWAAHVFLHRAAGHDPRD